MTPKSFFFESAAKPATRTRDQDRRNLSVTFFHPPNSRTASHDVEVIDDGIKKGLAFIELENLVFDLKKTPNITRPKIREILRREHLELLESVAPNRARDDEGYLTEQGKYWPSLVGSTLLPAATDDAAIGLAEEFERRLTEEDYEPTTVRVPTGACKEIGAAYVRYSDANSNTRSLDQQLVNILAAASRERVFVPWCFVFADAAISGTKSLRPGYQLLIKVVETVGCVKTAIVDELDRLSRDHVALGKFRNLLEKHGKRLITSNGYDTTGPNAKIMYNFNSLMDDMYIDQLKAKVDRGMTDCVNRGRHVAAPPLGYSLKPCLDDAGQPVLGPNRKLISEVVVNEEAASVVKRIFELYSQAKMSPMAIARLFNQETVLGRSIWNTSGIANLLTHELYIGVRRWKRTRNYVDPETERRTTTLRPAEEQIVTELPELRIITDELWEAVRKRKKEVARKTYVPGQSAKSRQSQYAKLPVARRSTAVTGRLHIFSIVLDTAA